MSSTSKWYRALSISGRRCGLAFECSRCGLGFAHDAPSEIFHCGAIEYAPTATLSLPLRQIGKGSGFPSRFVEVDW